MTISTTTSTISYAGNAATTAFPVPFAFFDTTDLEVIERVTATGVETVRALSTDYTVAGGGGGTGTVTALAAPPATVTWTIRRVTAPTQTSALPSNGPFPSSTVERMVDRVTAVAQEVQREAARGVLVPKTEVSFTLPSSVQRAGRWLGFDANGQPIVGQAVTLGGFTVTPYASTLLAAADAASTRLLLGGSATGIALFTAADAAAGRTALGGVPTTAEVQAGTARWGGTAGGTANTRTISLTPALAAYGAGLVLRFLSAAANTGAVTLAVNGLAAVAVNKGDGTTALAAGDLPPNALVTVVHDGTRFRLLDAVSGFGTSLSVAADAAAARVALGATTVGAAVFTAADAAAVRTTIGAQAPLDPRGVFRNLLVTNGATPNTQVAVTADAVLLWDPTGGTPFAASAVNLTIATGSTGANGLDTGTVAASTWYAVWAIWNGTTVAGLLSTSGTAPTMPSGYTHRARVGWVRTDGSAALLRTRQAGRRAQYVPTAGSPTLQYPLMMNSSAAQASWAAIATGNFVPPTAARIQVIATTSVQTAVMALSPNAQTTAASGAFSTNPPPLLVGGQSSVGSVGSAEFALEDTNIRWSNNSVAANYNAWCMGWEDNL